MEGSTNTAEAVERVKKGIAYGRSVGSDWAGPLVLNDIDAVISENDRLRSQITELEKGLKPFAEAADGLGTIERLKRALEAQVGERIAEQGGIERIIRENRDLTARVGRMREELEPIRRFVEAHDRYRPSREMGMQFLQGPDGVFVTWGQLRALAARAALSPTEPEGKT